MEEPPKIKKLDEAVINRIAAGEIIQRPANALKEMIENSLDAKSTNIQVTVKNGGLKLLQIQDNGIGIRKEDFEIVCERFTTSKLTAFEDLQSIATYGFRGEALASISHIAHLTITSKTAKDICAYRASYNDGKLEAPPKPIAGNQGTIITVEDLFYNMHVRQKALRSPAEEYQKVTEVVSKYAIHNAQVGFALKKQDGNNDIRTPSKSSHTENIKLIYGNAIARELLEFSLENQPFKFKVHGFITNVNYSMKKMIFLLFINHRLVDCQSLKKCIDQVYAVYLPKNAHPFVYLSLELDPSNVDVNVHPTKHEVHFLNEDQIVEAITVALETKLLGSNNSRVFYTQAKLPGVQIEPFVVKDPADKKGNKTINPKEMVRTDSSEQKLEKFFGAAVKKPHGVEPKTAETGGSSKQANKSISDEDFKKFNEEFLDKNEKFEDKIMRTNSAQGADKTADERQSGRGDVKTDDSVDIIESSDVEMVDAAAAAAAAVNNQEEKERGNGENKGSNEQAPLPRSVAAKVLRVETDLNSILSLRSAVEENCHRKLRSVFAQHVFVGCVDPSQALIQHNTKLYLCNTEKIMCELFYQFVIYDFQNFELMVFSEPLSIYELALVGLDLPETGWSESDGDKKKLANTIVRILTERAEMLMEYFSVEIDDKANLKSIPMLLASYIPSMKHLPMYVVRLATEVDWPVERNCFYTFARETAAFYSKLGEDTASEGNDWKWVTEHVLYPAIKEYFIPPKSFVENAAVLEIANLPSLYKVFERC